MPFGPQWHRIKKPFIDRRVTLYSPLKPSKCTFCGFGTPQRIRFPGQIMTGSYPVLLWRTNIGSVRSVRVQFQTKKKEKKKNFSHYSKLVNTPEVVSVISVWMFSEHAEESVTTEMSLINFVLCFMDVHASQWKSLKANSFSFIASEKKGNKFLPQLGLDQANCVLIM